VYVLHCFFGCCVKMSSTKRAKELCTNVSEVFQAAIQAQTRALARVAKSTATQESVRSLMREDCAKLGLEDLDRDLPPVIHIAGTKGKKM